MSVITKKNCPGCIFNEGYTPRGTVRCANIDLVLQYNEGVLIIEDGKKIVEMPFTNRYNGAACAYFMKRDGYARDSFGEYVDKATIKKEKSTNEGLEAMPSKIK